MSPYFFLIFKGYEVEVVPVVVLLVVEMFVAVAVYFIVLFITVAKTLMIVEFM